MAFGILKSKTFRWRHFWTEVRQGKHPFRSLLQKAVLLGIIFLSPFPYLFIFYLPSSRLPRLSFKNHWTETRREKMEIKCFYCASAAFILLLTDTPTSDVVREMQKRGKHYDNTIRPKLFFSPWRGLVREKGWSVVFVAQTNFTFFKWS